MKKNSFPIVVVLLLMSVSLLRCVDSNDALLEEARFLLDDRQYIKAIEKAQKAVDANPNSEEARFLLGSALLGDSVLSGSENCEEGDDGALGLLACLIDTQSDSENELDTFVRIAPDASKLENLALARRTLEELSTDSVDPDLLQSTYLRLYVSRLFEVASVMTTVGMKSENTQCNLCIDDEMAVGCVTTRKDDVPDGFDTSASVLTEDIAAQFVENLEQVNSDGRQAGLPSSFSLNSRITTILNDIGADQARDALALFFQVQFSNPLPGERGECDETL